MRKLLFGLVVTGTVLAAACGAAATSTSNPTPTVPSAATLPPAVPTSVPDATATPTPEPVATATPRPTATSTPAPTATPTPAPTATTAPEPAPTEEPDAEEPDTMEPEPTPTLEPTATSAPPPTQTPLPTSTPVPTATPAPSPTPSPTATQPVPVRGRKSGGHNGTVQVFPRQHHCRSRRYSELDRYRYRAYHYIGSAGRRDRDMGQWLQVKWTQSFGQESRLVKLESSTPIHCQAGTSSWVRLTSGWCTWFLPSSNTWAGVL